jgi:hypothetical protein
MDTSQPIHIRPEALYNAAVEGGSNDEMSTIMPVGAACIWAVRAMRQT